MMEGSLFCLIFTLIERGGNVKTRSTLAFICRLLLKEQHTLSILCMSMSIMDLG